MSIPRYYSDPQRDIMELNPEFIARGSTCPVCLGTKEYWYLGERHECPDDEYGHPMLRLAKLYWLCNIPLEYQLLLWDEYPHQETKEDIATYLENFKRVRMTGAGFTFYGKTLGVGKTWAATYILKELAKRGYSCWFLPWFSIAHPDTITDQTQTSLQRAMTCEVVVVDDIRPAISDLQRQLFEERAEMILRARTNANFPTMVTSNLSPEDFEREYPRCYSLLQGKNLDVHLKGIDARANIFVNNTKLALAGETRPIT